MKNLQGLLSVVEAAAAGSFTAAAARLDLTPAAVSKNVAGFEKALGLRLFQRGSRRLAITPEGQAFLDRAVPALAALQEAVGASTQASAAIGGRVRVSASEASVGRLTSKPSLRRTTSRRCARSTGARAARRSEAGSVQSSPVRVTNQRAVTTCVPATRCSRSTCQRS